LLLLMSKSSIKLWLAQRISKDAQLSLRSHTRLWSILSSLSQGREAMLLISFILL
jgi:hypothetical protein